MKFSSDPNCVHKENNVNNERWETIKENVVNTINLLVDGRGTST